MRLLECLLIENDCYKKYHLYSIVPTGITVHSTDYAGKVLKRFVQPASGQTVGLMDGDKVVNADQMIKILGKNIYGNSWNRGGVEACVHAFLGKLADESYAVCKTLEYTQPCWGGAFGTKGSYDGRKKVNGKNVAGGILHIQFEMIESPSGDNDPVHCKKLYDLAIEYCAYLCMLYPTIKIEDIVSHKEANKRGYASAHGDPEKYWTRCGTEYTMDGFRADVRKKLQEMDNDPSGPIYRVQVGAFRNKTYAEAFLAKVQTDYPNAYITTSKGGG